jgi:hypothetical protein
MDSTRVSTNFGSSFRKRCSLTWMSAKAILLCVSFFLISGAPGLYFHAGLVIVREFNPSLFQRDLDRQKVLGHQVWQAISPFRLAESSPTTVRTPWQAFPRTIAGVLVPRVSVPPSTWPLPKN